MRSVPEEDSGAHLGVSGPVPSLQPEVDAHGLPAKVSTVAGRSARREQRAGFGKTPVTTKVI